MSFWKDGFWADGFWKDNFWTGIGATVANYRIALHAESTEIQLKAESTELQLFAESSRKEIAAQQGDDVDNLIFPDGADILREDGGVILWQ